MHVLILHHHFNLPSQGGALRSYYLARGLVESGHRVSVWTRYNGSRIKLESFEGIQIRYFPIPYDNRFGFYARAWSFLRYVAAVVLYSRHVRQVDCCYAISTPLTVGLAALWLRRVRHIPFFFEVGDLWPDAPIQLGFIRSPVLKKFLYRFERKLYRASARIVVLSSDQETALRQKAFKPVVVIPNMADTDFFSPAPKKRSLEEHFGVAGKFVISYSGAIGFANGLMYLIDCAQASREAGLDQVQFLLCGDGAALHSLEDAARARHLNNLTCIPFQNRTGVRDLLNVTDVAMICYYDHPILSTGSPNKYFDALAAGKSIFINFGGWIKNEIAAHQCGLALDPKRPQDIVAPLRLLLGDTGKLIAMQKAARRLAEDRYARSMIITRFAALFAPHT